MLGLQAWALKLGAITLTAPTPATGRLLPPAAAPQPPFNASRTHSQMIWCICHGFVLQPQLEGQLLAPGDPSCCSQFIPRIGGGGGERGGDERNAC